MFREDVYLNQQGTGFLYLLKGILGLKHEVFHDGKLKIDFPLCRKKENRSMIRRFEGKRVKR